jgi:hypothetical protein
MLINFLKDFIDDKRSKFWPDFVIRNAVKEYLQFPVLFFMYREKEYRDFSFMGGSALRIFYNLPRLSEDLDFNLSSNDYGKLDLNALGEKLKKYFKEDFSTNIDFRAQGNQRLYLKFPILKELGLALKDSGSDFLYVKVEVSLDDFFSPEFEYLPASNFGFNFIAKVYSLKFLMTGKIGAILERSWYKGDNNEINIKGRDYYDLFWYLNKGVEPDYKNLFKKFSIKDSSELKKALKEKINNEVTEKKLLYDLVNFFPDQEFVSGFCKNYKSIINKFLDN